MTGWRLPPRPLVLLALAGCERPVEPVVQSFPPLPATAEGRAAPRISGRVGASDTGPAPQFSLGQEQSLNLPAVRASAGGDISLDFADTDIREVTAQILGSLLHVNYTIDPAVHGTATLHTPKPIASSQLLLALQVLLAQNNATLVQANGIYRVMLSATSAGAAPAIAAGLAGGDAVSGSVVVPLDGQTIGLAGLILDSVSRGNSGIPWLKDLPLLGLLAGTQNNQRTRTELLVLITPHVVQDQRRARELTEDLRHQLINAAAVPDELKYLKPNGSNDPNQRLRRALGLQQ